MEITEQQLCGFAAFLRAEERSPGTIEKYTRDVRTLGRWLNGEALNKERLAHWRDALLTGHKPRTVNGMLASIHAFLEYIGHPEWRVKTLRLQRQMFRPADRELTRAEYERLVSMANALGKDRLALLMETICAAGIRVSELQYITVESARAGRADVSLKGKIRTILLPDKLCRKLLKYAKGQGIAAGTIFRARSGAPLSRKQIWADMKALCAQAGVEPSKVFPHNLRHLFARTYYKACKDVAQLADILGHSSVETTRVYLIATGAEHKRQMDRLRLIA